MWFITWFIALVLSVHAWADNAPGAAIAIGAVDALNAKLRADAEAHPPIPKDVLKGHCNLLGLGRPCVGIQITLEDAKGNRIEQLTLDNSGRFYFHGLSVGAYKLVVESSRWVATQSLTGLTPGKSYTISFQSY